MGPRALLTLALAATPAPMGAPTGAMAQASTPVAEAEVTLTGVRLTQGDAVSCPQIRDDAGAVHTVSYLSPGVPIGGRVTVRGVYGIVTTCLGRVLAVSEEIK